VTYADAIAYLLGFTDMERGFQASPNPTMSLESMRSLLSRLNWPQHGRHTVHVTGSKGKGTTSAMIEGILRHAGFSTALYSSPHLHSYTERIRIGEEAVSPEEFAAGLEAIRPMVEAERESVHGNVSTFGVLTALFFWLVRAQMDRIDWQVVEVGLGGTFDATNVFDTIDVAVVTPISLEHTAILGSTPAEIAADKAGIIRPGCVCVLAPQNDSAAREVVIERCEQVGATLVDVAETYDVEVLERFVFGQSFAVHGPSGSRELRTPMLGLHQAQNAATAVAVAEALMERGIPIPDDAVAGGIARTRLPGRVEVMGQAPLMIADGAHNGESAAALATTLRDYFEWERCFLVLGAQKDKDVRAMGFKLASLAEMIVCTGVTNPRAMDPYVMIQEVGFLGPPAVAEASIADALDTVMGHANNDDLVCITGSLYLVAEARELVLGESVAP
jgi:dihydrofolate synthase / folylpolyglutamate synthase